MSKDMQIRIASLTCLVYLFSFSKSERIECEWLSEYLCGDKCVPVNSLCYCGKETIRFEDSSNDACCDSRSCFFDTFDRNVICKDRIKQYWGKPCNHVCNQMAQYGFSTLSCDYHEDNDDGCYMGVNMCRGTKDCYD